MKYTKQTNILFAYIFFSLVVFTTIGVFCIRAALAQDTGIPVVSDEITQLNQQLEEKKNKIKEVEQKKQEVQEQLNLLQRQQYSLKTQIEAVKSHIIDTEFEIEKKTFEIDALRLEIEQLATQIKQEEIRISDSQEKLGTLIRLIDSQDRTPPFYVLLTRDSFSSYVNDVRTAANIQVEISHQLTTIKEIKAGLEKKRETQYTIKQELEGEKESLERNRETLDQQQKYQQQLLTESDQQEKPYQELLNQISQEEDYANTQLRALENSVREKLLALNKGLVSNKNVPLIWPLLSANISSRNCASYVVCSALFHETEYKQIFGRQHNGVDIPVPQGTPVYAPADGYVVGVVRGAVGGGIGSLSILKIDHTDDQGLITQLSSKYLHMSKIAVSFDPDKPMFIRKGELIGYSGGLPGTMGSGTITQSTGPHLHFEVLISGIPTNPLEYLP